MQEEVGNSGVNRMTQNSAGGGYGMRRIQKESNYWQRLNGRPGTGAAAAGSEDLTEILAVTLAPTLPLCSPEIGRL